jgi:hypothetical protein
MAEPPTLLTDAGRLAVTIRCVKCGYNLRTLSPDGACPECGEAVARSLDGSALRFAPLPWLARVHRGARLMLLALLGYLVGFLSAMAAIASALGGVRAEMFLLITGLAGAVGFFSTLIGCMMLSSDPCIRSGDRHRAARGRLRRAVLVSLLTTPLLIGLLAGAKAQLVIIATAPLLPIAVLLPWLASCAYLLDAFDDVTNERDQKSIQAVTGLLRAILLICAVAEALVICGLITLAASSMFATVFGLVALSAVVLGAFLLAAAYFEAAFFLRALAKELARLLSEARLREEQVAE